MIPVWTKAKGGRWVRFPYEHLDTFEDGKQGIALQGPNAYWVWNQFLQETGWQVQHYFYYEPSMDCYVLKDKPGEDT